MLGALRKTLHTPVTFVSQAAMDDPAVAGAGPVAHARAGGELLVCESAEVLPMAQRYFLF